MSKQFVMTRICLTIVLLMQFHLVSAATSQEYYKRATEFFQKGKLNSAVIELKNSLQKNPKNAKARVLLGEIYLKRGEADSAEKELTRARELGDNTHFVQIYLGRVYLLQGKPDKVLTEIKDNDKYSAPVRAEILSINAQANLLKHNKEAARKLYEQAARIDSKSINAQLGLARMALMDKKLDKADQITKSVVDANPKSGEAWSLYAEITRLKGDNKLARTRFEKALNLEPSNLKALIGKASTSLALNDIKTSLATTGIILKYFPDNPTANYLHGAAYFVKKDLAAAESSMQKALRVDPNHIPSLRIMGVIDFSKGKYGQAEQALTQVVSAVPGDTYAAKYLASTYLKTKQAKQAINLLKPIAHNSKDPQLISLLGDAYMQDQQKDKGMEMLEKAAAMAPKAAGIQTQLALAQLLTGQGDKAVQQLESVIKLSPDLMQAEVMLTMVQLRNKEYQKALKTATNMHKKHLNDPVPLNLMGAAYLGLNKRLDARKQFESAVKVGNKFAPAAINLAKMDEQDGKVKSAIKRYKAILKLRPEHLGALMSLARITEKQGNEAGALAYMQKAYDLNPNSLAPGLYLIRYNLNKKDTLKALSIARSLKDRSPDNPQAVKAFGTVQVANKEYSSAILTFQSLKALVPNSPEPPFLIGKVYLASKDLNKAKAAFKDSLKLSADYVPAELALVKVAMQKNNPKSALAIAKRLQKQYPRQAIGYQVEGDVYSESKSYEKALVSYKNAMKKSNTSQIVLKLSNTYSHLGKDTENYQLLEKWLNDNPKDLKTTLILASIYQKGSKNNKAIQWYSKALALDPNNIIALNNLAWLYLSEKNPDALSYAEKAYKLVPHNPAIADTYGWLLVKTNDAKKGLEVLRQAVAQAPTIYDIQYHLAYALHKIGRDKEARSKLETLLKKSTDFSEVDGAKKLLKQLTKG